MAVDVLKWLTDDLGFTADEAKDLAPKFETRTDRIDKGFLRQSDYSKHMNDLAKDRAALDANNQKLNADMAEWAELTAAEKAQATDLKARIDTAEAKAFTLQQKLTRLAEEQGVDPKTLIGDEPLVKKVDPVPAAFDPSPLLQQIGGVAQYMLTLNAELPAIAEEHLRLTGERLDTRKFIGDIQTALKTGKATADDLDPVKRWEAQYDIPTKRTAATEKAIDDRIAAARAEERTAVLSEVALPGAHMQTGRVSPVFKTTNVSTGSKLQRPQPSQRLAGAVSALTSGKYRGGGGKAA